MRSLLRRKRDAADESRPAAVVPVEDRESGSAPASGGGGSPLFADPDAPTAGIPATGDPGASPSASRAWDHGPATDPAAAPPLPAGTDPAEAATAPPSVRRRGQARRRLRTLQRLREVGLRDLGGLVYEIHRSGTAEHRARHERLVAEKARALAALDAEIAFLAERLRIVRGETVLRQPGLGGACAVCGELSGSGARFCSACGARIRGSAPSESGVAPAAGVDAGAAAAHPHPAEADAPAAAAQPHPAGTSAPTADAASEDTGSDAGGARNGHADEAAAPARLDDTRPTGVRLP